MKSKSEQLVISKKKYPLYFYLILYSLPFIFFISLEIGLGIFGYGLDIPQWVQVSKDFPNRLTLNPEIAKRYFTNLKEVPTPWVDGFEKNKSTNTFRVFVFGESSTAGFPYDLNASFPKEIKRRLDILYPESNNEVINLAMTAINSYTFEDLVDGVIEQKPDLIIFYAGHNEYYGALGVGSNETLGNQFWVVRSILKLEKLKTIQLLKSAVSLFYSFLNSRTNDGTGTIMKRMVGKQQIPLYSELYKNGISQFNENMNLVLSKLSDKNIPVLLGTVASNLKDQKPFISQEIDSLPSADSVFSVADNQFFFASYQAAKLNYIRSKDLDLLRFRAPSEVNNIIRKLSITYKTSFVDIDSAFNSNSANSITGNELMADHLHPNLSGYRLMGELFFKTMEKRKLLPKSIKVQYTESNFEQTAMSAYPLTKLDSVIGDFKIRRLKMSWPFVPEMVGATDPLDSIIPNDIVEKYALEVIRKKTTWEEAHADLGQYYLKGKNYVNFMKEFNALISFAPYSEKPYEYTANALISSQQFDDAIPYLQKLDKINSSAFSNKWLGIIFLTHKNYQQSISHLEKSCSIKSNDPQVLYNLSGAYYSSGEFIKALDAIDKCLNIKPDFNGADNFRTKILQSQSN